MRLSDVMNLIETAEAVAPVDAWRIDGLHVWPLARERLVSSLEDVSLASSPQVNAAGFGASTRLRAVGAARDVSGRLLLATRDHAHATPRRATADIFVLSDNVVRLWYAGGWYDEIAEPFIESAEQCGYSSVLAEMARNYRAPRSHASRPIQPQLDVIKAVSLLSSHLSKSGQVDLPGHEDVSRVLLACKVDPEVLSPQVLAARARHVIRVRAYFERLLGRAGARIGVTTSYGVIPMAFHAACARRGIPSLDVQHGVQGSLHWAYARWGKVPGTGYELLPAVYWVWTGTEAQTIERWVSTAQTSHRVVVGGNLWLERWRTGADPHVHEWDSQVRALVGVHPASRHVLVTLQAGAIDEAMLHLLRSAAERTPQWRWWIRTRATMSSSELRRTEERLTQCANVELQSASTLPLYALLRHMDAHLTAFSTTVIEAEAFGVPSVTTSAEAAALYPDLASTGWIVPATGVDAVVSSLDAQMRHGEGRPRVWRPPSASACSILEEIQRR
jgi:hypothetical protein